MAQIAKNNQKSTRKSKKPNFTIPASFWERWTERQNKIYAEFLENHEDSFSSQWKRRSTKIFVQMSKALGTRNTKQCKSHHQKMLSHYRTLQKIREKLKKNQSLQQLNQKSLKDCQKTQKCLQPVKENKQKRSDISILKIESYEEQRIYETKFQSQDSFIVEEKYDNQSSPNQRTNHISFIRQEQSIVKNGLEYFDEEQEPHQLKIQIHSCLNLCDSSFDTLFDVLDLKF